MRQESPTSGPESISLKVSGTPGDPVLVYLPGLHGDWTLNADVRRYLGQHCYFLELTYPRTVSWTLEKYATEILGMLRNQGVGHCWLLAESFSSIVAWEILRINSSAPQLDVAGLILAGGFVTYPLKMLVRLLRGMMRLTPAPMWKLLFWIYGKYALFRHRHAPEVRSSIHEFIQRRTPEDIAAMVHRLSLILGYDHRSVASSATLPVFAFAGVIDPIVPAIPVKSWLQNHCPGFRSYRFIARADHNVLATQPAASAELIAGWIKDFSRG